MNQSAQVAIVGAGIAGIATAYSLVKNHKIKDVILIDAGQPMAFTSAQSGENYRNWWPHPAMVDFMDRSIDLLEEISLATDNRINMSRRGYALATRAADVDRLLTQLHSGLGDSADKLIRIHESGHAKTFKPPHSPDWREAPEGFDILLNQALIRDVFPSYHPEIRSIVHIRRGGDISGQQLGSHMLEAFRADGGKRLTGTVKAIAHRGQYELEIETPDGVVSVSSGQIVNAAGPFAGALAEMLDVSLPICNVVQQKIAFQDKARAIPRDMPFSIDLDRQFIDWSDDEREFLLNEPDFSWLAAEMRGAIHCRPDGGDSGSWVKLGWAFNETPQDATWEPPLDDQFPEIVLRGAARLNPSLKAYYEKLPRQMHHYGGWYTMTEENWPLIGPMGPAGAFMNCALSGFGTMAACASGELCAAWIVDAEKPTYAHAFSLARYEDKALMSEIADLDRGVL